MDEYFDSFLYEEDFTPVMDSVPVDEATLAYFRGKLPDRLLGYWKEYGFAGFGEGLFWMVNPNEYQEIVDKWMKQTPIWGREKFYAVARSAFGVYHWCKTLCIQKIIKIFIHFYFLSRSDR